VPWHTGTHCWLEIHASVPCSEVFEPSTKVDTVGDLTFLLLPAVLPSYDRSCPYTFLLSYCGFLLFPHPTSDSTVVDAGRCALLTLSKCPIMSSGSMSGRQQNRTGKLRGGHTVTLNKHTGRYSKLLPSGVGHTKFTQTGLDVQIGEGSGDDPCHRAVLLISLTEGKTDHRVTTLCASAP
jgi:hypothetical protein